VKALIVNGDDFGRSPQVNAGILRAHRQGVLTSASLMVSEKACAEAVAAARDCPRLDVGLHVVACNGPSLLPARQLRGLVDAAGRFATSEVWAGIRYALQPRLCRKLRDEFRAQIERHFELVGYLNHLNGHHNLHLHPVLSDILLELAAEYHVPCVRLVREPFRASLALASDHPARKLRDHIFFRWLSARTRRRLRSRRMRFNDWTFGFHQTGHLTEAYVMGAIDRLPENSATEFYFHPAVAVNGKPPMSPSQARETELLTSPKIRSAIEASRIHLTTFRELAGRADSSLFRGKTTKV
jgi:chitin disaccharide deacetylase